MAREPPARAGNVGRLRAAAVSSAGGSRAKLRERRPLLGGVSAASGSRRRSASGRQRVSRAISLHRLSLWLSVWLVNAKRDVGSRCVPSVHIYSLRSA